MEERLDKILVQRELVNTRVRAEQVIQEIGVKVNGRLVNKPGKKFALDAKIEMLSEEIPWVSTDAIKFIEALTKFEINPSNQSWMDIGCSTGGGTEILIHHGASSVFAIDSNKQVLSSKIQELEQVVDLTGTPVRSLTHKNIPEKLDGCIVNAPFLGMEKVFPFVHPFMKNDGDLIAVIKPQLEADKIEVGHNGQLRDKADWKRILERIKKRSAINHMIYQKHIISPILGKEGQEEFLFHFKMKAE
jgi:23S rRNA (cytidine1920-2'-O)/16S rRNA (cytidine1409-2'-O)-methyltransferase